MKRARFAIGPASWRDLGIGPHHSGSGITRECSEKPWSHSMSELKPQVGISWRSQRGRDFSKSPGKARKSAGEPQSLASAHLSDMSGKSSCVRHSGHVTADWNVANRSVSSGARPHRLRSFGSRQPSGPSGFRCGTAWNRGSLMTRSIHRRMASPTGHTPAWYTAWRSRTRCAADGAGRCPRSRRIG